MAADTFASIVAEPLRTARFLVRWMALGVPLGIAVGSAVALFLASLDAVTALRWREPWLLYLLPVAGLVTAVAYRLFGPAAEAGNNLILDRIHEPGGGGVPLRMAPLVLVGTLLTHLCGGSAGREGTAVQMGGGIAGGLANWLRLAPHDTRLLLMAGVAAGFGAVFGTPLAGAVFAIEVLAIGRLNHEPLVPCLVAALVGDATTTAWGIEHMHYLVPSFLPLANAAKATAATAAMTDADGREVVGLAFDGWLLGKIALASLAFALASVLFSELTHGVQRLARSWIRWPLARPIVGGLLVIGLTAVLGRSDYLGLGVVADPSSDVSSDVSSDASSDAARDASSYASRPRPVSIVSSFSPGGAEPLSWLYKTVFTAVTVGHGFKGGEVTPLFFVGASLGNVMAKLLDAPVGLFAALGFVAVFGGATKTPLASTLMALELFPPGNPDLMRSGFVVYVAAACLLTYVLSGQASIYLSQRSRRDAAEHSATDRSPTLRELRSR
jgi:H+/Cl- antiporter ClcA